MAIVAGNLPSLETFRKPPLFKEVSLPMSMKNTIPKIWYSTNASFELLSSHLVETELGTIVITQFALY
jgi:hypothetical protein